LKLGLALGGGGAKGFAHLGVLKVLEKHGIKPDYIAGTSAGAIAGAAYAAGNKLEEIEEHFKKTNWQEVVDFAVPKRGLVRGKLVETQIRELINNKSFGKLDIPLSVVAYNLSKMEPVVFTRGDVASAVRASISIPGVFSPQRIDGDEFIDGAVSIPTPFDIVRKMGADVVIAVDLFYAEKITAGPVVKERKLYQELKKKFIVDELGFLKDFLFPLKWPRMIRRLLSWLFDKLLYPARVIKVLAGREQLPITKIMSLTTEIIQNNLAKERLNNSGAEIKITPKFLKTDWSNFDHAEKFVRRGERAMEKEIERLKRLLRV